MYSYNLQNTWNNKTEKVKQEIIDFWMAEKALLRRDEGEKRVDQVFLVAKDAENGKIIGVNTVYKRYNHQLENYFYYYRTFISSQARSYIMLGEMMRQTIKFFESRFLNREDPDTIGILLEVENKNLQKKLNRAIWPSSQFVFMGRNQRGDHIRVYYFKNACIS